MALSRVGNINLLNTSSSPATAALPGGAEGDLLIIFIGGQGGTSIPVGHILLDQGVDASSGLEVKVTYHYLTAAEILAGTVSMPGDPNSNGIRYYGGVFHDTTGSPQIHKHAASTVTFVGAGLPGSTSWTWPTFTTTIANALVQEAGFSFGPATSYSATPTTNATADTQDLTHVTGWVGGWLGHFTQAVAGAITARSLTAVVSVDAFEGWGTASVAVGPPTVPAAPAAPIADPVHLGVHATLVPPDNGGATITSYSWQYSVNGGGFTAWGSTTSVPEVVITGLTAGTSVVVQGAATNGIGTGSYSSSSNSVTVADMAGGLLIEGGFRLLQESGYALLLDIP